MEETIVAVATGRGGAGIGIVRLSGAEAVSIAERIFRPRRGGSVREMRSYTARYGRIVDPVSGEPIDEAVLLLMRAPASYTREDVVEIQCHGGSVVLQRVLDAVLQAGARPAEPGEFTRRAFLNGRIDLAQAEAVADLVGSRSEAARQAALQQLGGALSRQIEEIRQGLLDRQVHLEAVLDFPEDEIDDLDRRDFVPGIRKMESLLEEMLGTFERGRVLRDGLRTAIIGKPNVGKSSLLNALAGREKAIVTPLPGTTRDVVEEQLNVGGVTLVLQDTAGLHETEDPVERLGIERSRAAIQDADLVLWVLDDTRDWDETDEGLLAEIPLDRTLAVINKIDTGSRRLDRERIKERFDGRMYEVSALAGTGLNRLTEAVREAAHFSGGPDEAPLITHARHRDAIARGLERLEAARLAADRGEPEEILAFELRQAAEALGEVTGRTATEEILDEIFSRFCIGK